jgi:pterin-4a-carbinolamine dehydratase
MSKSIKISNHLTQQAQEKEKEVQLINKVSVLLKTLIYQEEITIKEIIDCLYDVGSTNLINQKFNFGTFNKTLKFMTKMSKPAFKMLAWQWVKKNSPNLITNWLQSEVTFIRVEETRVEVMTEDENISLVSISPRPEENQTYQVKRLNLQVKLLTVILVTTITLFGGSLIWLTNSLQQSHLQTVEKLQNQIKTLESSTAGRN